MPNSLANVTRFPMIMTIVMYANPQVIKAIPIALIKKIIPMMTGFSGMLLIRLAIIKKRPERNRNLKGSLNPASCGILLKKFPGSLSSWVSVSKYVPELKFSIFFA